MIGAACGDTRRVGFDHLDPLGTDLMRARGIEVLDSQAPLEQARTVKSADEIACMKASIAVCEAGMARMYEALRPGVTENRLWAILHEVNIANGGEWIETRLLSSGGRTNPRMQECGEKIIRPGELLAFGTDLAGAFGYCTDISRIWFCGPGRPTAEQKRLYPIAHDQIQHNIAQVKAGMSFRELSERGKQLEEEFEANGTAPRSCRGSPSRTVCWGRDVDGARVGPALSAAAGLASLADQELRQPGTSRSMRMKLPRARTAAASAALFPVHSSIRPAFAIRAIRFIPRLRPDRTGSRVLRQVQRGFNKRDQLCLKRALDQAQQIVLDQHLFRVE